MNSKRKKEEKKLKNKIPKKFRIPKQLLKIYLIFCGTILILFTLFSLAAFREIVIAPFSLLVAQVSGFFYLYLKPSAFLAGIYFSLALQSKSLMTATGCTLPPFY